MDIQVNRASTRLFIGIPCYQAQLHAACCEAIRKTSLMLGRGGIYHRFRYFAGASAINVSRNILVAEFMASRATHLLFIDSDLQWEPEAVARLLSASQLPDIEACCAVYPKKCLPLEWPCNFRSDEERNISRHPDTGFIELFDAPTGFLMLRRAAIERLIAAFPDRKCRFRQDPTDDATPYEYNLFDFYIDRSQSEPWFLSEDFGFTRLFQQAGGRIWADPDTKLSHYGQYKYTGDFSTVVEPE